jgi:magnesium-transporting ATPase (P-type)
VVEAGNILPADLRFTEVTHLKVDESILTGDSVALDRRQARHPPYGVHYANKTLVGA